MWGDGSMKFMKIILMLIMIFILTGCISFGSEAELLKSGLYQDDSFDGTIILGRPTTNTMDASLLSHSNYQVYLEWGSESQMYTSKSPNIVLLKGLPYNATMMELEEGEKHYYRLAYRSDVKNEFSYTKEYSFQLPRASGESFNFVVQSDSHLSNKADHTLYKHSMETVSILQPDFFLDLGDTFINDQSKDGSDPTIKEVESTYVQQRAYFDEVCREAPLFLTIGNHEGEYGSFFDGTIDNIAALSTLARTKYYINPIPNTFYSGNEEIEPLLGAPQNYYAYKWGDALFVSIDPYRYSSVIPYSEGKERSSGWDWTLGETQYEWFKKTLEESDATFKFVSSHHAIGNMRGGADIAKLYEWGGYDKRGDYVFDKMRKGWEKPIHQIMEDEGVSVFFQGHDHLFSRELVDGVTYLTLPKPAERVADIQSNYEAYSNGDTLMNSGIVNVKVEAELIEIDYIRHFLVAESSEDEAIGVVYRFTIDQDRNVNVLEHFEDDLSTYGTNDETLNEKTIKDKRGIKEKTPNKNQNKNVNPIEEFIEVHPEPKDGFTFAIQADSHLDDKTDTQLYTSTLQNMKSLDPSFVIDLGDTSMVEKLTTTESEAEDRFILAKSYLDILGDKPLYLVTGNHDGENGYLHGSKERAGWALENRLEYFPFPLESESFTGNVKTANYYSFTKENALFIALDPFTYSTKKVGQAGGWASTLGDDQYDWLVETLQNSDETFKFVFIHHLAGGYGKDQRGGAEAADLFEWGGYENLNPINEQTYTFSSNRKKWSMPIHDLLKKYEVDAVFHGHDHFYAHQDKDGMVYQLVPQPGTPGNSHLDAKEQSYNSGTILPSAGFLRVSVSDSEARVEYVRTVNDDKYTVEDYYIIEK